MAQLLIFIFVCSFIGVQTYDPCKSYTFIENEENRSPLSVANSIPKYRLCDVVITERWYRAYKDMPTFCIPQERCGTIYPIWLNGTIPTVAQGVVERRACVSSIILGCCVSDLTIKVKNCGDYRVYRLVQTNGCSQAYCFGTMETPSTHSVVPTTTELEISSTPKTSIFSTTGGSASPAGTTATRTTSSATSSNELSTEKTSVNLMNRTETTTHSTRSRIMTTPATSIEDPCTNNMRIQDERRSPACLADSNPKERICDVVIKEGWYRGDYDMPTECISQGRCGTIYPIWINGTIPTVAQGVVNRRACVSSIILGCCASDLTIQVKNCGDYRVYKLVQTNGCSQAYCFGDPQKTSTLQTKSTTYKPATDDPQKTSTTYKPTTGDLQKSSTLRTKSTTYKPTTGDSQKTSTLRTKSTTYKPTTGDSQKTSTLRTKSTTYKATSETSTSSKTQRTTTKEDNHSKTPSDIHISSIPVRKDHDFGMFMAVITVAGAFLVIIFIVAVYIFIRLRRKQMDYRISRI